MNRYNDVKKHTREAIEKETNDFLRNGKKIEEIKFGISAEIPKRIYDLVDFELIEIVEEIKKDA